MLSSIPPALLMMLGAPLMLLLKGKARVVVGIALPLLALAHSWAVIQSDVAGPVFDFLGYAVAPVTPLVGTKVFATIFCLMAATGVLFTANRDRPVELAGAMIYAGGALGVTFSGDWISLFMFWEVMTLGSTTIIFSERSKLSDDGKISYAAGMRYFALHAVGGVILFAGIAWLLSITGDAALGNVMGAQPGQLAHLINHGGEGSGAAWLILIGMLINAGAPPFSAWVADAYPAASETGTVFLSAFTTKTAVFTLLGAFAGTEILIYVGMYMACYGIVYAILENDIRRILAYSIVNQVGFMLCGIGMASMDQEWAPLAVDGVCAHAFAHIIYKALLLMSAGAVVQATGKKLCSEVGGLYRTMPVTMWCGIIGALAISSFPFTSGYTTKSMITSATWHLANGYAEANVAHGHLITTWFVLEAASAGVFLHAGIKFPWFVFFQKDSGLRPPDAPLNMKVAMILFAFLCIMLGMAPNPLYEILPYRPTEPHIAEFKDTNYSFGHLIEMLSLLLFSGLAFFLLLPLLKRTRTITLDTDWLYRRFIPAMWQTLLLPVLRALGRVHAAVISQLPGAVSRRVMDDLDVGGQKLSKEWRVGATVVLVTLMLCFYLVVQFLAR